MSPDTEALLRSCALFSRLSSEDRRKVAEISVVRQYATGDQVFAEGDPSDLIFTIVSGRVKVVKAIPGGKELIIEILGSGDPLGAIAAYEARPYPASAVAFEDAVCIASKRGAFMALLETCPSLVRGMLGGFSMRVVELGKRLASSPEVAWKPASPRSFSNLGIAWASPAEPASSFPWLCRARI